MNKEQIGKLIDKYEKEYMDFMGLEEFPKYKVECFEININKTDAVGFGALAQAKYNPHTDEHTLRICSNLEVIKYVVFHEFTHILDAEMYAKNNPANYAYLSGYTEYHASQIELMFLLGKDNIHSMQQSTFSLSTRIAVFPNRMSVAEYLHEKHQFILDMMCRDDFPKDLETLKSTIGVLYNYLGIRSVCKMYGTDYIEGVDNTNIIKWIPLPLFSVINTFMQGWFDQIKVEKSFGPYSNAIFPLAKECGFL